MRKLAEGEILSLTGLLKLEKDGIAVHKAMQGLISDAELKKEAEAGILASQNRVNGLEQFINENNVTNTEEVR